MAAPNSQLVDWGENDGMNVRDGGLNKYRGNVTCIMPPNATIGSLICNHQVHLVKLVIQKGTKMNQYSFIQNEVRELVIDIGVLIDSCKFGSMPTFYGTVTKLTVTGSGKCEFPGVCEFRLVKELTLAKGFTSVGKDQFRNTGFVYVNLPDTIETINDYAFCGCIQLQSCALPSKLKSIGRASFANCAQLWLTELPRGLKQLGRHAFFKCMSISKMWIPPGVELGESPFEQCNISAVTVPENELSKYRPLFPSSKVSTPRLYTPLSDEAVEHLGVDRSEMRPEHQTHGKHNLTTKERDTVETLLLAFNRALPKVPPEMMDKILQDFDHKKRQRFGRDVYYESPQFPPLGAPRDIGFEYEHNYRKVGPDRF